MPQHQDFRFKLTSRLETVAQRADEKKGNCEHPAIMSDSLVIANPLDGVFGTDRVIDDAMALSLKWMWLPSRGVEAGATVCKRIGGIGLHTVCKGIGGSGLQTPDVTTAGSGQQITIKCHWIYQRHGWTVPYRTDFAAHRIDRVIICIEP